MLDSKAVVRQDAPYFIGEMKTCSMLLLCSKHCSFSPFLLYLQGKFTLQLQGVGVFICRQPLRCPYLSLPHNVLSTIVAQAHDTCAVLSSLEAHLPHLFCLHSDFNSLQLKTHLLRLHLQRSTLNFSMK